MDVYTIGIDLGGTNLRIAAYAPGNPEGSRFLTRIDLPTRVSAGPASVIQEIAAAVRGVIKSHPNFTLAGIGLGTPGPLELPAGILHELPNFPGWDRFPLRAELESALGQAVHIEGDANVAALAECILGAGLACKVDSLCMLTLGTGVGNAIILNGAIWSGAHGMAGEAGHTSIWPDGVPCNCGNRGCLEVYASATAVRRMAQETAANSPAFAAPREASDLREAKGPREASNPREANGPLEASAPREASGPLEAHAVFDLARRGDPDALRIFATVGAALGIALGSLINTLDLRLYVIGGGLAAAWEFFSPAMFRELETRSYVYRLANQRIPARRIEIVPAVLGSDSGLLGAALLPLSHN